MRINIQALHLRKMNVSNFSRKTPSHAKQKSAAMINIPALHQKKNKKMSVSNLSRTTSQTRHVKLQSVVMINIKALDLKETSVSSLPNQTKRKPRKKTVIVLI